MKKTNSPGTPGSKENKSTGMKSSSTGKNTQRTTHHDHTGEEGLRSLLVSQLKDIYWAEKALTKAIPKLIENASAEELASALETHLAVTESQVNRCEEMFSLLGLEPEAEACEAMKGLIEEGNEIIKEYDAGAVRDAGIICATQKVEHYEIATYGSLAAFAHHLGETEVAGLLEETLLEEKEADEALTEIAVNLINLEATQEVRHEE